MMTVVEMRRVMPCLLNLPAAQTGHELSGVLEKLRRYSRRVHGDRVVREVYSGGKRVKARRRRTSADAPTPANSA